ncbi:MAG: pyridoxal phosphate-dependent aminotransferase [Zoogloeaceae bacterium]|nr:pyridoxal phosphate-dependent aminotransferase [Rhodocyclaceae bacterium]MCP5293888.1 pyridoxal phosphate-dependent aminotransferase [Zoogloeaceae bacterium]
MPADFPIARRMHDIQPFRAMRILVRASELQAQGEDVIHMEVGEPDFPTPPPICEAGARFIATGNVRYSGAAGIPRLREAIARFYHDRFGVDVAPERIIVTNGASGALMLALGVTTNPGDEWLIPDPSYPSNRHFVRAFEGTARSMPVDAATAFQPTLAQVEAAWTPNTRGLMVATPSNPTGTLLSADEVSKLNAAVRQRGGIMLVDEIYQGLTYGVADHTALARHDDVFVVNSFSKFFGMTGWRLGWLVAPSCHVGEVEKLAQHFFISPSTPAQHAALAAFEPATLALLEERRSIFRDRRDLLLPALQELGMRIETEPQGAFYIYADVSALANNAEELAARLLEEAFVATTPGADFGHHRANEHLRIAYTTSHQRLEEAVERMRRILHR